MIIEEISLTSFKGFRDFSLKCLPFTTLVGLNSNGKTSILQAIQLLHDIFVFAFRNSDKPDFSNPRWEANPSQPINRISYGDPDAIWLHKITSEPCKIAGKFTNGYEVSLEISGQNRYKIDILKNGVSIKTEVNQPEHQQAIYEIFALQPTFVPPVSAISPIEDFVSHPQFIQHLDRGQIGERWRSSIFWWVNDGRKESFDEAVMIVKRYFPNTKILPPQLTHDNPPRIMIQFEEDGTTFDIGTSGSGLRTLLGLAVVLRATGSKCLLFDEPDSHLHSSLQRVVAQMLMDHATENGLQVFLATHAPDFIAEIPVENLIWIDRTKEKGLACSEVGRALVELGSITSTEAINAYGADKILYIEGILDRNTLSQLLRLASTRNPFEDPTVIVAKLPHGKGDVAHLPVFQKLLRETFGLEVKIACITDQDFNLQESADAATDGDSSPLTISLERKEVENYFLDPEIICKASVSSAQERERYTGTEVSTPTVQEIEERISHILNEQSIRDTVKFQVMHRYRETLSDSLDQSSKDQEAERWFTENWANKDWQIKHCSGKVVLKSIREWIQDEFSLTLSNNKLISALDACPQDVAEIGQQLETHFYSD